VALAASLSGLNWRAASVKYRPNGPYADPSIACNVWCNRRAKSESQGQPQDRLASLRWSAAKR
jgi:hypothetical protein